MSSLLKGVNYPDTAPLGAERKKEEEATSIGGPMGSLDIPQVNISQEPTAPTATQEDYLNPVVANEADKAAKLQPEVNNEQNDFFSDEPEGLVPLEGFEDNLKVSEEDEGLKGTPGVSEASEYFGDASSLMDTANKIAYGAVRGLAGFADVMTSPGWVLANVALPENQATSMPFTSALEEFYPEKEYRFEEDDTTYIDEALRITQTTAEFVSPAGPANLMAKTGVASGLAAKKLLPTSVEKAATYLGPTTAKADTAFSAVSGAAYQSVLEGDGGQGAALAASFLAPMSPQVARATWNIASATPRTMVRAVEHTPLLGTGIKLVKGSIHDNVMALKANIEVNPDAWDHSVWTRMAKKSILAVPDSVHSLDQQIENLKKIQTDVHKIIDIDNPDIASHHTQMEKVQDMINKTRPADDQLELTLDQIYRPVLDKMNDTHGFDTLMGAIRVTNETEYTARLRKNHRIFSEYLAQNTDKIDGSDAVAFKALFEDHMNQLNVERENIIAQAMKTDFVGNKTHGPAQIYEFPHQPMEQRLLKQTEEIRDMMYGAYEGMLKKLPADTEVEMTPLKNSIVDMYENMGTFNDPTAVPNYVKQLMGKLVALGKETAGKTADEHKALLDKEAKLVKEQTQLIRSKNTAQKEYKAALDSIPENTPDDELKALKAQHKAVLDEKLEEVEQLRNPVDDALAEIGVQKREVTHTTVDETVQGIPEPTFTDVGSVTEAIRIVGELRRNAYKSRDVDRIENLNIIYKGLEDTLEGLKQADEAAYDMYTAARKAYSNFMSRDFNESLALTVTDTKGGRERRLTSTEAVSRIWTNGDPEGVRKFMRNFDSSRNDLEDFMSHMDHLNPKTGQQVSGMDDYVTASSEGVRAMRDIVFTDMAQGLREFDLRSYTDPAKKLSDIEEYVRKYVTRHEDKLAEIPGFEKHSASLKSIIKEVADYSEQVRVLDEQRNLYMLKNITGPGRTIMDVAHDSGKAKEMAQLLESLGTTAVSNQVEAGTAALSAEQARRTMYNSVVRQFTEGTHLDGKGLLRLLQRDGDARYNLSLVLGDQQIAKLEGMAMAAEALQTGQTKMTDVLTKDTYLKTMEQLGLPMGRIGSMLSRRVVFQPSTGYMAGAFMAKLIDKMGQQDTSRTLKVLFDNPLHLTEIDNFVLNSINELTERQQKAIQNGLQSGNLTGAVRLLEDSVSSKVRPYLASLGIQMTEGDIKNVLKDAFMSTEKPEDFDEKQAEEMEKQLKEAQEGLTRDQN